MTVYAGRGDAPGPGGMEHAEPGRALRGLRAAQQVLQPPLTDPDALEAFLLAAVTRRLAEPAPPGSFVAASLRCPARQAAALRSRFHAPHLGFTCVRTGAGTDVAGADPNFEEVRVLWMARPGVPLV